MSKRLTPIVEIKKGNYGFAYSFVLRGTNRSTASGFCSCLTVWMDDEKIVSCASCASSIYNAVNDETVITCIPATTADVFDTAKEYYAEITFTRAGYLEDSKTFIWRVLPTAP